MPCRPAVSSAPQSAPSVSAARTPPDLVIRDLRGNVGARLGKLDNGDYDAIILAVAGLEKRLKLDERVRCALPPEESLPAVGRGAVVECQTG